VYDQYADSRALIPDDVHRLTAAFTDGTAPECADAELLKLLAASTTDSTKRSYESDVRHFSAWGGTLPATPLDVARYLATYASRLSVATLARRLVAIGQAHTVRGFPNPATTNLIRLAMRGVRRTYGVPQRRVAALNTNDILSITSLLGDSLIDLRDRALLLVGFAGAFRRSELVAIDYESVRSGTRGIEITIPRSKSDQEGHGRIVAVPYGRTPACPVSAFEAWLSAYPVSPTGRCSGRSAKAVAWEPAAFRPTLWPRL
jgi:integrase